MYVMIVLSADGHKDRTLQTAAAAIEN